MSKKYLLYIHNNERFELEVNKSALINELLAAHYNTPIVEPRVVLADVPAGTPITTRKLCRNGHTLDKFGNRCMDKECKYS